MIKVSVIIPVYNAEKYLHQCLDSVLGQSLEEIEIICVDDVSSDNSREILAEYAQRDARVNVYYNEKNMFAGPCRNRGLEKAKGEYVFFMDSDDWLLPGSLEKVYESARRLNADVLRCRALDYNQASGETSRTLHNSLKRLPPFLFDRLLSFKHIYWLLPKFNVAPWGGICRRQFLLDESIAFNDLICVNDRSFYWESMLKAERIAFSREELICYRTNMSTSLVGSRIKNYACHFRSYELVYNHTRNCPPGVRRCILDAELLDMANWLEKAEATDYFDKIAADFKAFVDSMDKGPWNGNICKSKWYARFSSKISQL